MKTRTNVSWLEGLSFEAKVGNHSFIMDASEEVGGQDKGVRPKPLLLAALGGCTGMDVVSILKKMGMKDYKFAMDIDADSSEDHPVVYTQIVLRYQFWGENLSADKIKRAIELSKDKYCGVSAMLKKAIPIEVKIIINDEEIK